MRKRYGKRLLAGLLFAAMILSFAACGPNVMKLEDFAGKYSGPLYEKQMTEAGIYRLSREELRKAWGGENTSLSGNGLTWRSGEKWINVYFDEDAAIEANVSVTLMAAVVEDDSDLLLICPDEGQWELRSGDRIYFSRGWLSDEQAAQIKVGTQLKIEYDGLLMETSPMQIHRPYAVEITGFRELEVQEPETSAESGTAEEPAAETTRAAEEPASGGDGSPKIVKILDDRAHYLLPASEFILQEGIYRYSFPSICMDDLDVLLSNGETISFRDAVEQGYDVITALTRQGLRYTIQRDRHQKDAWAKDPVDSLITAAILDHNGSGDPDVIRLEDHQMAARLPGAQDGTTDWFVNYFYQEYVTDQDGEPRLHYQNSSSMVVTVADGEKKTTLAVRDLTGENYQKDVSEVFPASFAPSEPMRSGNGIDEALYELLDKPMPKYDPDSKSTHELMADTRLTFALQLFQQAVKEDPGENVLVAPLSVQLALAMTANGAEGETLQQMEEVVCGGRSIYEFNEWVKNYMFSISNVEGEKLTIANSLWVRENRAEEIKKDFLHRVSDYYSAPVNRVPFDEGTVNQINDWVKEATDGMIRKILESLKKDSLMVLVNALTFDAKWYRPFMNSGVRQGAFTALDGTKQDAEMLECKEEDSWLHGENVQGFLKKYEEWQYGLAVLMPDEGVDLYEFIASLTPKSLNWLVRPYEGEMLITMPKFSAESEMELTQTLSDMGMPRAFETGFCAMVADDPELHIDEVRHKTFIDVTEEGTRAGAATAVVMEDSLPEISVTVDRPFIYMIVDSEWIPVFMGVVTTLE